jgi:ABC-2 type transport system ATP-binding protein
MLHDPDLIFLDEPTVGIDPIGAREIRVLIKNLVAMGKTILLTSHYMYEMEELCDRIAVVNHGKIIALDTPAALKARSSGDSVVSIQSPHGSEALLEKLQMLNQYLSRVHTSGDTLSIFTKTPSKVLNALAPLLEQNIITNLEVRNATLEDVYVQIVQNNEA